MRLRKKIYAEQIINKEYIQTKFRSRKTPTDDEIKEAIKNTKSNSFFPFSEVLELCIEYDFEMSDSLQLYLYKQFDEYVLPYITFPSESLQKEILKNPEHMKSVSPFAKLTKDFMKKKLELQTSNVDNENGNALVYIKVNTGDDQLEEAIEDETLSHIQILDQFLEDNEIDDYLLNSSGHNKPQDLYKTLKGLEEGDLDYEYKMFFASVVDNANTSSKYNNTSSEKAIFIDPDSLFNIDIMEAVRILSGMTQYADYHIYKDREANIDHENQTIEHKRLYQDNESEDFKLDDETQKMLNEIGTSYDEKYIRFKQLPDLIMDAYSDGDKEKAKQLEEEFNQLKEIIKEANKKNKLKRLTKRR
jgi:hypothetical protein